MAVVAGTILEVFNACTPTGPQMTGDTTPQSQKCCFITVTFTGTYVQGEDASIAGVDTAIAAHGHQGGTVTLLGACPAASGLEGTTEMGIFQTSLTVSGGTITCQLSDATLVAEHAGALLGTANRPVCLFVSYKLV